MENNWMPDVYSDVPVAYAVFDLIFAEDGKTVQDTKYVFANKIYCEMVGKTEEDLVGNSFRSIYEKVNPIWMTYCARACHEGKAIRDCIYAPEIDHWLDFTIMPLAQPGYVAYTFMNVDLDRARQMEMKRAYTTNDIILRISKILSGEEEYDVAMNHALRELSHVLHPDRLHPRDGWQDGLEYVRVVRAGRHAGDRHAAESRLRAVHRRLGEVPRAFDERHHRGHRGPQGR